jgi:predicted secreted Zn-dependent protease
MQKSLLAAIIAFLTACASAPRNPAFDRFPAGITGHTTLVYYDVHGSTFSEVAADMRAKGAKLLGGNYVGEARSPMQWRWRADQTQTNYCTIRDVIITVNSEITLPRWTPPAEVEPGLVDEWKRFMAALEIHEAGHKDISAKAGREIVRKLNGMSDQCGSIAFRGNEVAHEILERASQEQAAYDATTGHGRTQGTTFGRRRQE